MYREFPGVPPRVPVGILTWLWLRLDLAFAGQGQNIVVVAIMNTHIFNFPALCGLLLPYGGYPPVLLFLDYFYPGFSVRNVAGQLPSPVVFRSLSGERQQKKGRILSYTSLKIWRP